MQLMCGKMDELVACCGRGARSRNKQKACLQEQYMERKSISDKDKDTHGRRSGLSSPRMEDRRIALDRVYAGSGIQTQETDGWVAMTH